jgi:hypothetical protein
VKSSKTPFVDDKGEEAYNLASRLVVDREKARKVATKRVWGLASSTGSRGGKSLVLTAAKYLF